MAEILADGIMVDDRRRMVNAGLWHGRDVVVANHRAIAEAGANITSTVIAIRGRRLAFIRGCNHDMQREEFDVEFLTIVEIDADKQIVAHVAFDVDDFQAAIADLDARYLAGEAAAYSHTWEVITGAYAAINRREPPPTTPDWVNIDHRRGISIPQDELPALLATWNLTSELSAYIEAVHRLNDVGVIVNAVSHETSHEGLDTEWRVVGVITLEGDRINRLEVFDETDLDSALARFDDLTQPVRRLENTASRVAERLLALFGGRQFDAIADILADDTFVDDRRRVVNSGLWRGRDAVIVNLRAFARGAKTTSTVIAIRGERLTLARICFANRDLRQVDFDLEMLSIVEIDADHQIAANIVFDPDDIDAAFEELDARYLVGEAAAYSHTWSVITNGYDALNRRQVIATTPDT